MQEVPAVRAFLRFFQSAMDKERAPACLELRARSGFSRCGALPSVSTTNTAGCDRQARNNSNRQQG
jgi:hypothetical protein